MKMAKHQKTEQKVNPPVEIKSDIPLADTLLPPDTLDESPVTMDDVDAQIGLGVPKKAEKKQNRVRRYLPAPVEVHEEVPTLSLDQTLREQPRSVGHSSPKNRALPVSRDLAYYQLLTLRSQYYSKDPHVKANYFFELERLEKRYEQIPLSGPLSGNALRYAFEVLKDIRMLKNSRGIHNQDFFRRVNFDLHHVYKMRGNRNIVAEIKRTLGQMRNYKVHFERNGNVPKAPVERYYNIDCSQGVCVEQKMGR